MSTDHHTPHPAPFPLDAAQFNAPLGQLDQAVSNEEASRIIADNSIYATVAAADVAETMARNLAITAHATAEATARNAADATLQSEIDAVVLGAGAALYTTLDGSAASGQKVIPLTSTTGAFAGQVGIIRKADGSASEAVLIASVSAGVSVTATDNLANSYVAGAVFSISPLEVATARSEHPSPFAGVLDDRLAGIEYGMSSAIQSTQRLMKKLYRGDAGISVINDNDAAIVIFGDSTSEGSNAITWPHELVSLLAADHPAWTVKTVDVDHSDTANGSALAYTAPVTIQTGTGPNTLTVYFASVGQMSTDYHLQALPVLVQTPSPDVVLVAHGINESGNHDYIGRMARLTEAIGLLCPRAATILILENPRSDSAGAQMQELILRQNEYQLLAAAKGYGLIDIWQAFWDEGGHSLAGNDALTTDGIHPLAGSYIDPYAKTVYQAFTYWPGAQIKHQSPSSLLTRVPNLLVNGDLSQFENLSPTLVDRFERTTASGWGTPPTGSAWAVEAGSTAGNFSTDGTGVVTIPSQPLSQAIDSPISVANPSLRCSVTLTKLPNAGTMSADVRLRYVDASNYYRCAVQLFSTGQVNVSIVRRLAGANTTIGAAAAAVLPGGYAAGRKLWVAAEIIGAAPQHLGVKAWVEGTPEPEAWKVVASETQAALAGAAGVGFELNNTSATNLPVIRIDDLEVNDATANLVGWAKTRCSLTKDYVNYKSEKAWAARLLADGTANDSYISQSLSAEALAPLLGRNVTLAARCRVAAATAMHYSGGQMILATNAISRTVVGAQFYDGWWWNVLTLPIPINATTLQARFYSGLAAQPTGDVTVDRIVLCEGILPHDMIKGLTR